MRETFARLRAKLLHFMSGRYGNDQLNRFLSIAGLVFAFLAIVLSRTGLATLLWLIAVVLITLVYVRMLSRNVYKRSDENTRYLRKKNSVVRAFNLRKERWKQRKSYKFFTCPSCSTTLRVPRGKGKINIVCRKCGNSFQGKT